MGSTINSGQFESPRKRKAFLKRFFRRNSAPDIDFHSGKEEGATSTVFTLLPSPSTHPLLSKPCAREEALGGRCANYGNRSRNPHVVRPRGRGVVRTSSLQLGSSPLAAEFEDRKNASTVEQISVQEWDFFKRCYAEGRFNMSSPPEPPPKMPNLGHFSAPNTITENSRLKAVRSCNAPLASYTNERCQRLVVLATKIFQTRMGSISFIDDKLEHFYVGGCLLRRSIDRHASIGAHVLLSNEPMVILDTAADWRFSAMPIVQEAPNLRFYAGAPLLNSDSEIVGVFAVFDTQPRESFPFTNCRKLMEFSKLAMAEIETRLDEGEMLMKHTLMKYVGRSRQPSIWEQGAVHPFQKEGGDDPGSSLEGFEADADRFSESTSHFEDISTSEQTGEPHHAVASAKSAFKSSSSPIVTSCPCGNIKTHSIRKQHHIPSDMPSPPLTPSRSISIASSLQSSISAGSSIFTLNAPQPPSPVSTNRTISESRRTARKLMSEVIQPAPCTSRFVNANPTKNLVEASFAVSIIARSLGFDLVYLLRVSPIRPDLPEEEELAGNGIHTQVLVAYAMPEPKPIFDGSLHLRVLRSHGGLIYTNPNQVPAEEGYGYQFGILLPLFRDNEFEHLNAYSPLEPLDITPNRGEVRPGKTDCRGGVVLCAFTKAPGKRSCFTEEEVRYLRDFGGAMRDILLQADYKLEEHELFRDY